MSTIEFPRPHLDRKADTAVLQSLEDYWQTLRHADRLPARSDIAPDQIDQVLPHAFILQRVAPGTARFRVAGQRLHDLLRIDARGMPFSTLFAPQAHDQLQELVEAAFMDPAIVALPLRSESGLLRPEINGTMLLLPMRDQHNDTSRILGAIVTEPVTGTRPQRFLIAQDRPMRRENLGVRLAATQLMPRPQQQRPDAARPALKLVVNNA
ncbi:PAS domain-containing protein [Loktanella sp. Alg231-35]|uniref:PAS domain-containing protein n=1 Tax=Loktanella sp. Alg231-35 TaxID=1922220 RepID=UPI000D554948|nr:PAS domain-containing protein [Loktanella sp. Alg231-35]